MILKYVHNIFGRNSKSEQRQNELFIPSDKNITYGDKSIRVLDPYILNMLPNKMENVVFHTLK